VLWILGLDPKLGLLGLDPKLGLLGLRGFFCSKPASVVHILEMITICVNYQCQMISIVSNA
jgi:hypothetical protein